MNIDLNRLLSGDRRTLARAITLIESSRSEDHSAAQILLSKILPYTGKSQRIGVTGVPGVGKSTFIESFGQHLLLQGKKLAILAIDPSSPISGGSILGDRTRMEKLSSDERVFIRPSPSSGFLGGVAQKTRETLLLCEAAGFDTVLVETVGVGQSEFEVFRMVDFFMVLMLPNSGDEIQGIKKGILELAHAIVVNKADGDAKEQAEKSLAQFQSVIDLIGRGDHHWKSRALICSALMSTGIDSIHQMIQSYFDASRNGPIDYIKERRLEQNKNWFIHLINELIALKFTSNTALEEYKSKLEKEVVSGKKLPLSAAQDYLTMAWKDYKG